MAHLYASFADASLAEKAAGALLDYGVRQEDISLVAHDEYGRTRESYTTQTADAPYGTTGVGERMANAAQPVGNRLGQAGDRTAGAVTGAFGAEGMAAGYESAAGQRAALADVRAANASGHNVEVNDNTAVAGDLNPLDQGGPDSARNIAHDDVEAAAKHGISTTTAEDAGSGAVKGTGIGLVGGIIASLAVLTVPGFGLVLGGGVLASAIGATALAAGAGAVAGGVTGYLKDQGVPSDAADRYHGAVENGGAVLSLNIPSGDVDQATAQSILSKYGASDVNAY
jgi:hypothetical protein